MEQILVKVRGGDSKYASRGNSRMHSRGNTWREGKISAYCWARDFRNAFQRVRVLVSAEGMGFKGPGPVCEGEKGTQINRNTSQRKKRRVLFPPGTLRLKVRAQKRRRNNPRHTS